MCLTTLWTLGIIGLKQKQPVEEFYRIAVFKYFAIFAGKQLCWSLFLLELQTLNLCNRVLSKKKNKKKTNKQTNKQAKQNKTQTKIFIEKKVDFQNVFLIQGEGWE